MRSGRKCLVKRGVRVEPPIGIEPMTYEGHATWPHTLAAATKLMTAALTSSQQLVILLCRIRGPGM